MNGLVARDDSFDRSGRRMRWTCIDFVFQVQFIRVSKSVNLFMDGFDHEHLKLADIMIIEQANL